MKNKIPNGLHKCEVCGEYNGQVMEKDLSRNNYFNKTETEKSNRYLTVFCLCKGILCPKCKQNKINRPISNSYHENDNNVWHWPWFSGMMPCKKCREKQN